MDKSNPEIFDDVNVYGNIYDSDIHHMNFGVYTYGHQQGDWRRNKMHDNSGYGFDPHDDSDFLTIHDNEVYNNGYHGIIASKRCNGVSIQVRFVLERRTLCRSSAATFVVSQEYFSGRHLTKYAITLWDTVCSGCMKTVAITY